MAITNRKGLSSALVKSKLLPGELAVTTDTGELYFCYSAGNVKNVATSEDVQALLDSTPEAYSALQQLLADLALNPSELTNILNHIENMISVTVDLSTENPIEVIQQADAVNVSVEDVGGYFSGVNQESVNQEIGAFFNNFVLADLGSSVSFSTNNTTADVTAYKYGKIIIVSFVTTMNEIISTTTKIGTVTNYLPYKLTRFTITNRTQGISMDGSINTSGEFFLSFTTAKPCAIGDKMAGSFIYTII